MPNNIQPLTLSPADTTLNLQANVLKIEAKRKALEDSLEINVRLSNT